MGSMAAIGGGNCCCCKQPISLNLNLKSKSLICSYNLLYFSVIFSKCLATRSLDVLSIILVQYLVEHFGFIIQPFFFFFLSWLVPLWVHACYWLTSSSWFSTSSFSSFRSFIPMLHVKRKVFHHLASKSNQSQSKLCTKLMGMTENITLKFDGV